jgi:hypothetical protein
MKLSGLLNILSVLTPERRLMFPLGYEAECTPQLFLDLAMNGLIRISFIDIMPITLPTDLSHFFI